MATIKDWARMCKNLKTCDGCVEKTTCPLAATMHQNAIDKFFEKVEPIVENWAAEHPAKTYLMDFKERFPSNTYEETSCPCDCVYWLYGGEKHGVCKYPERICLQCWNQLIEE